VVRAPSFDAGTKRHKLCSRRIIQFAHGSPPHSYSNLASSLCAKTICLKTWRVRVWEANGIQLGNVFTHSMKRFESKNISFQWVNFDSFFYDIRHIEKYKDWFLKSLVSVNSKYNDNNKLTSTCGDILHK
jgi:hypothetical protein